MKKWNVYWINGNRIASLEQGSKNAIKLACMFTLQLFQTDCTGTQHFEIQKPQQK